MNKTSARTVLDDAALGFDYSPDADLIYAYGAPNDYEREIRKNGALNDVLEHLVVGDSPDALVLPSEYEVDIGRSTEEHLRDLGIEVDYVEDLDTTADDIERLLEVSGPNDNIHGHTSDYHARAVKASLEYASGEGDTRVFGHHTDFFKRESNWKHNVMTQTVLNTPRQLWKLAKRDQSF